MHCSVVIPCHNGADLTRACIDSLLAQTDGPPDEILVVDNGSTDDTGALGCVHPNVRVLPQARNLGFAGGVNAGLRAASCPFVLVLNNDTQATTDLLRELHAVLSSSPRIGAVAPVSNHVKGPAHILVGDHGRSAAGRAAIAEELRRLPVAGQDVDSLAGLCLLMRRTTLAEVGLFDERFGHGNFEDDDFSLRLRIAGYRLVIARRAFLHHDGHATFRHLRLDLTEQLAKRRQQFLAKWQTDAAGRAVIAGWCGDLAAAASAAREAVRTHVRWPDADWHLGRWHAANGEHDRAACHFAAFLRQCPHSPVAAIELGLELVRAGAGSAAQHQLTQAIGSQYLDDSALVHLWLELGRHAYQTARPHVAEQHFRDALRIAPHDGGLHNWIGTCRLEAGALDEAADCFRAAIEHGFPLATTNLGICLHRCGDVEAAIEVFAKAVELLPHDPVAKANHDAVRRDSTPAVTAS